MICKSLIWAEGPFISFRNSAMQGQYCKFRPRSARNIPRIFSGDEVIFIAFFFYTELEWEFVHDICLPQLGLRCWNWTGGYIKNDWPFRWAVCLAYVWMVFRHFFHVHFQVFFLQSFVRYFSGAFWVFCQCFLGIFRYFQVFFSGIFSGFFSGIL